MSIDGHIEAWEIGLKLEKSTWYKKPQNLKCFHEKACVIYWSDDIFLIISHKYDELVRQYETKLVDYINLTMNRAKALGTIARTQSETDNVSAKILLRRIQRVKFGRLTASERN